MTPEEFAIAQQKLGWTDMRLAAELNVTEKIVRRWTDGSLKIPKYEAKRIAWEAALAERDAALRAAGIRECEWVKSWEAEELPKREKDLEPHFKRLDDHAENCPTCRAREQFVKERFPSLPEMPTSGLVSTFQWWDRLLQRFPEWTHPVFNGAVIVTALTAFRVLPGLARGASPVIALALPAGAAFGAIGGLAYSALRPLIKAGGPRRTLAHILVLLTYVSAGFAVWDVGERLSSNVSVAGSIGLWSFIVVSAVVVTLWRRTSSNETM